MRKTTHLLILFTAVISIGLGSNSNAFGHGSECVESFLDYVTPAKGLTPDLATFKNATPLIDGGISRVPIRDQACAEICWSYGTNELADQLNVTRTGKYIETSADHNGFWHFYFQVFQHGSYFSKLAFQVKSGKVSLDDAVGEAIKMLSLRGGSKTATAAGFIVQSGNDEPTALAEVAKIGLVPNELFDRPIATEAQATQLVGSLKDLVATILTSQNRLSMFKTKDPDGVNTPLYNLMTKKLSPVLNVSSANKHMPYRPSDKFTFSGDGNQYTPIEFMSKVMRFNAQDFTVIQMTAQNQDLINQAMKASLTLPQPVPVLMGFAIYNQEAFQTAGVLSVDGVNQQPVVLAGGHLTMNTNMKVANGVLVGSVFQNSWNLQGLDGNGNPTKDTAKSGYDGITNGYQTYATQQGEPASFIFPNKGVLDQPAFSALLRDAAY